MTYGKLEDALEERAMAGDGASAIALALFQIAHADERLAVAVDKCGMNIYQAEGAPGALEMIGMEMMTLNESLRMIAVAAGSTKG